MKIYDENNFLLATFVKFNDIKENRVFHTSFNEEFQIGTFKYKKSKEIKRHIHKKNKRNIEHTSEAIVVLKGRLKIGVFDKNRNMVKNFELVEKDSIVFHSGGHAIDVIEDSIFIEFKQGPYNEQEDKVIF